MGQTTDNYGTTTILGKVKKTDEEEICISHVELTSGKSLYDIREYVRAQAYNGPTKKGFRITKAHLIELSKVLANVVEGLKK